MFQSPQVCWEQEFREEGKKWVLETKAPEAGSVAYMRSVKIPLADV